MELLQVPTYSMEIKGEIMTILANIILCGSED
jgi:hypothetical protein